MARIFIGIPTFNRSRLVQETIASIRSQTFHDYQVIVSDNRSDATVADCVARYVAGLADPRFSFYQQQENGGEYGQGRFFFRAARDHEFFIIVHDDDVLSPQFLETAIGVLDRQPASALFVANPYVMDASGVRSDLGTAEYLRSHGRAGMAEGPFDILRSHLIHGFTPISGTLFRRGTLERSGFADADGRGNYPFECDVFVRLGEIGAQGWFSPQELLGLRFHGGSMRSYLKLIENPSVVRATLGLLARRRFSGSCEWRRRVLVSRLHRAEALIKLRQGDIAGCRASLRCALRANRRPHRGWGIAPLAWLCPGLLRAMLPPLPVHREGPDAGADALSGSGLAANGLAAWRLW